MSFIKLLSLSSKLTFFFFFWCCVGRDSRQEEGEEIGSLCPLPVDSFLTVPPPRRPFTLPLAAGRVSCSFWHPTPAAGFSSREVRFSARRASPLGSLVLVAWTLPFGPPVYKRSSCSHSSYLCSIFCHCYSPTAFEPISHVKFPLWKCLAWFLAPRLDSDKDGTLIS